jgi:beta-glucosidase
MRQDSLIDAVTRANPRAVVVLNTGSVVTMPWIARNSAVLETWYPEQEGGEAIAALLLGESNPAGKLPVTFPRSLADVPTAPPARYPGVNGVSQYDEGTLVGYRWYDTRAVAPLFPFGHGLSYTTFSYSTLIIRPNGDGCDVAFKIRNTGARRGAEVAQIYVGAPTNPAVPMAAKQLVGFERVELDPGESRELVIHVDGRQLSYWSTSACRWEMSAGRRSVLVGSSSRDIRLRGTFTPR